MLDGELLLETRRFRVERVTFPSSAGGTVQREIVRHPGSVVILPVLDDGRICLIRNYRPSVDQRLIELPAGTREPGEPPEETAARELEEETGYRAGRIERITSFLAAPGILDEEMILYRAEQLTAGPPRREPGEEMENLLVTMAEAHAMIDRGEIRDAKTLLGLLLSPKKIPQKPN